MSVLGIKLASSFVQKLFNCSSLGSLVTYLVLPLAREYLLFSSLLLAPALPAPPKT